MITTLQHRRLGFGLGRILMSLMLTVLLSLAATQARAVVTFSYTGSHSLTWTSNSTKYVTLARIGGSSRLTVNAFITGSSKFTLGSSSLVFPDSSKDTTWNMPRYLTVQFSSNVKDTCLAWLVIYDSTRSDTIALTGYGTFSNPKAFAVYDTLVRINVRRDSNSIQSTGYSKIYNVSANTISLGVWMTDSTHFDVNNVSGGQTVSIVSNSDQPLAIHYTPHGLFTEVAYVVVGELVAPYRQSRITVIVTDSAYAPANYKPTVIAPDLGIIALNDSACGLVTVANANLQSIIITDIRTDSDYWSESGKAQFPLTLLPAGTTMFTVCYHSNGNDFGQTIYNNIYISYRDSSGKTGTMTARARVRVSGQIDLIRDSLVLDDVVTGGFVEATAIFIVHKDTTVSVGTAVVSGKGHAQVISPSLPKAVHAGDTINLRLRVTPGDSTSYYSGYLPVYSGGSTFYVRFWGKTVVRTSSDSAHGLSIYANENELIAMRTSNSVVVDTFWFKNNYGGTVTVSNAKLSSGAHFSILGYIPGSLPISLSANQSMGIIVQFSGDTLGFYHDSLYVDASHNIWSQAIDLEAMMTTQNGAGVQRDVQSNVSLFVSPNPATGPVQIAVSGARTASVEVYDLLGSRVVSLPNAMEASWNANGMSGGAYIVRASGVDENGEQYTITKRLILVK
jgi:hypothetical protein